MNSFPVYHKDMQKTDRLETRMSRIVTHGFLALLTWLALELWNDVKEMRKSVADFGTRISVLESRTR